MPILTDIALPTLGDGSPGLHGVVGVPDGVGPWPGVVMVHEAFGLTDIMRRQVERSAEAGFLTLMPDLFVAGGPRKCLRATFADIARGSGRAFDDVESARRTLVARDDHAGGVGILGFCMGGGFALMAVRGGDYDAASVNYGRLPTDLDAALEGACPIVASYGGRDLSLRGAGLELATALSRHGVEYDMKVYPNAGHAFLDDENPVKNPVARFLMRRVLGVDPDPVAATDAWIRIDTFFHRHLITDSQRPLT